MVTISLCMILKNEEDVIGRCLDSVQDLVDEINIIDTGSTDQTKEIVSHYTNRIFDFTWIDDFAAARNFAFKQATQDYILWLDADDILRVQDQELLDLLKRNLAPSVDAVSMHYNLTFDYQGNVSHSLRRNRLVKRSNHFQWHGAVHEYLAVGGNILQSEISVTHLGKPHEPEHSDRNLRIYEQQIAKGITFTPRDLFYYANECFDHRLYQKAIRYYNQFLDTEKGWSEDCISACGKVADAHLELQEKNKAVEFVLKSFSYDTPRAENCCRLGLIHLTHGEIEQAVFWYDLATKLDHKNIQDKSGFINNSCYTWVPHVQLCVCYDRLGKYRLAKEHNDKAKAYDPQNPAILHNEDYLNTILWEKKK
ncbi:tetratricopeptide repeat-containing glycosyltransferase family 2 protein [Geomicrobium halophilum]|uniref:tetratricopeptide repeat-containing glycosyltransferase family 2 protein n=1 Tax=Geomicrobium halophilum TaxID=549000 RepID=UPI00161E66A4|nr:glycosyltransferase family 2 protein [Geomicrobium halophilum]